MRSNRKTECEALEKVAVKAAHFVAYEWGAEHADEMHGFFKGNLFELWDEDKKHLCLLEMPFSSVVLHIAYTYGMLGHFDLQYGEPVYKCFDRLVVRAL